MKLRPFHLVIIILVAASVAYKLLNHFEEKLRFALLPFISEYRLPWLLDVMIGLEIVFVFLLLLKLPQQALLSCLFAYFSIHLAMLAYQKLFTACSECVYHSNFIGESINTSIVLFFIAIVSVLLAFVNARPAK